MSLPVTHRFEGGVLHIHAAAQYEPAEIPRAFLAGLADPLCPRPVALLLDVRESEVIASRHPDQIREVAEFLGPHAERIDSRCAVVTSCDSHFGMARMGAAYSELVGVHANVFRSSEDALAWLRPGTSATAGP